MYETNQTYLPENTILNARYQIVSRLNKGPLTPIYQAIDLERKDHCTIRELFPPDAVRDKTTHFIHYQELSPDEEFRLQHIFIADAKEYSQMVLQEFLPTRDIFNENCTHYHVIASLENKKNLNDIWNNLTSLPLETRINISKMLVRLLEQFKKNKTIHLQLTPQNIYLNTELSLITILPGSRSLLWYSDKTGKHSQILDPWFSHPACLNKNQYRNHQCDIYSIWKILLHLLPEKYLGNKTPQQIEDLYKIFTPHISDKKNSVEKKLTHQKFECPACNDLLEIITPLPNNTCPACREGILQHQKFASNRCAKCKTGILHTHSNSSQLGYCPICQIGKLSYNHSLFHIKAQIILCLNCNEGFLKENNMVTRLLDRKSQPLDQWLKKSTRTDITHECDHCQAQFDEEADKQWKFISLIKEFQEKHLPKEWARIAANVHVGAGNTFCNNCHANFDVIQNSITPIQSSYYSSHFFDSYQFQLIDLKKIKWLGMNKHSACPGLICRGCKTEFDAMDKTHWKLVWTPNTTLQNFINESYTLINWHMLTSDSAKIT